MEGVLKMQKIFRGRNIIKNGEKQLRLDYYLIEESKMYYNEENPRNSYGIEIIRDDKEIGIVKDITINKEVALEIIDKIVDNQVFPVHLLDVVEDLL